MKLNQILIISFVLVAVLGSVGGTYFFYLKSNETLTQQLQNHLETAVQSRASHIETWLEEQKNLAVMIAESKQIEDILLSGQDFDYLNNVILKEIKEEMPHEYVYELYIADSNGIIIASSDQEDIGKDKSSYMGIIEGRETPYIKEAHLSGSGKKAIDVLTPIINDETGEILGVLLVGIEITELNKITTEIIGLGETGEIYLINKEGYMITDSRFLEDTFLKQKVDTAKSQYCFRHSEEEHILPVYSDYRGIDVLGSHTNIEEMNWCLLAEIDETEALSVQRKDLLKTSLIVVIAIIFIVSLIGYFISKQISSPIKKLTQNVDKITKGDFDVQPEQSSINEIQSLTNSLNRILASMKLAVLKTGMKKEDMGIGTKEALEAKKRAEKKYKILYDISRDAIMTLAPPGWKFTAGNPATVRMFRTGTEKKFTNLGPWDVSPEKQPDGQLSSEKAKKMIMKAMKEGSNFFEWAHKRYKGKEFSATVLLTRVEIEKGKPFLQATVRDITEQKKTEAKAEKRTKELERFAKLSEGREKKMIELKKRIKELEKKNSLPILLKANPNDFKKAVKKQSKKIRTIILKPGESYKY